MVAPAVLTAADAETFQHRVAGWLRWRGALPGDRLLLVCSSGPDLLLAALGALRCGVVPVLLNPALTPTEQVALEADADPVAVVRDGDLAAVLAGDPADLADVPLARPMHYTSGTTGTPKGVWSGVLGEAAAAALLLEERDLWGFTKDDVNLVVSPLHHSAPLRFAAGTLLAGGTVVVPGPFTAERTADAIAEHRPTTAFMAPAHLQRVLDLSEAPPLSSFRLLAHAGAPCPEPLKRRALAAFPRGSVWEFYGATEGQFTACGPDDWQARPTSVGRPRPGRTLATDPDGTIWCTVPGFARFEYWRAPAKTAAAWRGDAFSVGDLGRLDDDGFLHLDGRRDDLVITGGVNVYPLEVEVALLAQPGVEDCAVFGVVDERWGHRVVAAVVGPAADAALMAGLAERLAPYKRPKEIVRVDAIPRSATGKVRRSRLAADLGLE